MKVMKLDVLSVTKKSHLMEKMVKMNNQKTQPDFIVGGGKLVKTDNTKLIAWDCVIGDMP